MSHPEQRYRVIEKIAAGGMAEVYRAESAGLEGFKKTVAIKRVLPHLSQKREFIGMFLDEARLSAALSHSNVVQVFDIGVGDDTHFIVMEYVDGANLKAVIEHRRSIGKPLPVETACFIALRICEGLAYAHEARDALGQPLGIVHRDVSPPNVLITRHGEVKVVDFGLAKANSQLEASQPGIIKGKFSYLSPEAALGESVDHRTDIFATGIILWEMMAGQRLFLGDTDLGTVRQVQAAQVPAIERFAPDAPRALQEVLKQALARDPRQRYQTARDFGRDLNRILFELGRPVSSFDIGGLVSDVREEVRKSKGSRPKQQTLIGTLIQDAMMSFTSIQDEAEGAQPLLEQPADEESGVGAIPLNFGSFEPTSAPAPRAEPSRVSLTPAGAYEAGNLAALEDHPNPRAGHASTVSATGDEPTLLASTRPNAIPGPAGWPAQSRPSHPMPNLGRPPQLGAPSPIVAHSPEPGLTVTFWIVTAALVAAGAAAGAYFAGVFN